MRLYDVILLYSSQYPVLPDKLLFLLYWARAQGTLSNPCVLEGHAEILVFLHASIYAVLQRALHSQDFNHSDANLLIS